ncbi:MAG: LPS assembly lipoprotein LptE [Acidobacteriota bacterium]|nr:LPS assembly lipoprotein LptE [Acidobacteriota bacterium]
MRYVIPILISIAVIAGAQTSKPRVAIQTFENPANLAKTNIGDALTEIVTTELAKNGKYRIVDRQAVGELMKEIQFGRTDNAAGVTFAAKGGFKGAEFLLVGKITNFSFQEKAAQVTVRDRRGEHVEVVYQQIADVRIDFRFIKTKTTEVILSESASDRQVSTSAAAYYPTWSGLMRGSGFSISELQGSIMGKATEAAVKKLVRKLTDLSSEVTAYTESDAVESRMGGIEGAQGAILAEAGPGVYIVSLGAKNRLVAGDHLKVFTERPVKNSKGEVIFREKQEIALLEAKDTSSSDDRASVRLLNSNGPRKPQEGDIVVLDVAYARSLRLPAGGPANGAAAASGLDLAAAMSPAGVPASGDKTAADAFTKKGDRYYEDGYFNQAAEQYQKAAQLASDNAAVLNRLALAHVRNKALLEAETTWESMLSRGMAVVIPFVHEHTIGSCAGNLQISSSTLSYMGPASGHSFEAKRGGIGAGLRGDKIEVRIPGEGGKDVRYALSPAVLNFVRVAPIVWRRPVTEGDLDSAADQMKLTKLVLRLIRAHETH